MPTSDSMPPRNRTPAYGVASGPLLDLADQVSHLVIRVDRLNQANKILKWVATTAAVFALGATLSVAKMVYGWGRDDADLRADVRANTRDTADMRAEHKELRSYVYNRRATRPNWPASLPDSVDDQPAHKE